MAIAESRNDRLTIAVIGLLAMCVVTCDHEALGHGSACLLLGGHIKLITSSLFRCDVRSGWIDPAGPACNLLMGTLALVGLRFVPAQRIGLKLFLVLVTAFSYFWEGGYLMHAMHQRNGDLYFFAQFLLGEVTAWQRWVGAAIGLALFVLSAWLTSRALLRLWPQAPLARDVARTAWFAAAAGGALAALAYTGHGWSNFSDAVLEIGAASFPLLFIAGGGRNIIASDPHLFVARNTPMIVFALIVYALFVATLGRGIGA